MRRREFISLIGGAGIVWPFVARAQPAGMPIIAFFGSTNLDSRTSFAAAFRKGLTETGYIEGQNVQIEYHGLEGRFDRLPAVLADVIRRRVTVIVTPGSNPSTLAAKAATSTIPIVFGIGEDPVALGLVASLAHPGGNVTGFNYFGLELNAKRLELMHQMLPKARRFAVLVNSGNATSAEAATRALKAAASVLGLEVFFVNARTPAELDAAFATMARDRADALFVAADGFFNNRRVQIATLAVRDRIPGSFVAREAVEAGGLMSYGTSVADMFRQVGVYAGSILKGAKPADLPVLQATKFEFVINLQTAKTLGIDIPPMLLALADEVIE